MKILIDTNILISAALFPESVPARAYMKAVTLPHYAVVCDYSMDEMRRVFNRKFSHKIHDFESFVSELMLSVKLISTPPDEQQVEEEVVIRDVKDRPILRAAILEDVDIILTGDKDFLESGIEHPQMVTSAEFLSM